MICGEEFELRPDKPGFANRCPSCTEEEASSSAEQQQPPQDAVELLAKREIEAARRKAIRDLLYSKDA